MGKNNLSKKDIILIITGAILLFWGLNNFHLIIRFFELILGFLFPLILGCSIAFLINIPLKFIEKGIYKLFSKSKHKPGLSIVRPVGIIITLIFYASILTGVFLIIIPEIKNTLFLLTEEIPKFLSNLYKFAEDMSVRVPDMENLINEMGVDLARIAKDISAFISNIGGKALMSSLSFATSVFSGTVNFILAFTFAMYLVSGKEKLGAQAIYALKTYLSEHKVNVIRERINLFNNTFSSFFAGQCLEACILGLMFLIGMNIFRFP